VTDQNNDNERDRDKETMRSTGVGERKRRILGALQRYGVRMRKKKKGPRSSTKGQRVRDEKEGEWGQ